MGRSDVKTSKVAVGKGNMEAIPPITEALTMDTQHNKLEDTPNSLSFLTIVQHAQFCKMTHNIKKVIMKKNHVSLWVSKKE